MTNFALADLRKRQVTASFLAFRVSRRLRKQGTGWAFTIEGQQTVGGWTNPLETYHMLINLDHIPKV